MSDQSKPVLFHIAERVLGRPLLLHPDKAHVVLDVLAGRIAVDASEARALTPDEDRFSGRHTRDDGSVRINRAENGVAIIPIVGSLVNRGAWIGASSGLVSYEGLAAQVREAEDDPNVHAVVLDIDSFGGEANGASTLAAQIRALAEVKPVVAVVNDVAASAGYKLASAAREIVVSPTSIVGSIGVVLMHVDRSAQMEKQGLRPTFIYAGAHKVDGNPFEALPDDVRAEIQAEVDQFYGQFLDAVAAGRGARLTADAARATEARVFIGQDAIDRGLADRMGTFSSVLAELTRQGADAAPIKEEIMHTQMVNQMGPAAGPTPVEAFRQRVGAILGLAAARDRGRQAAALALETALSPEQAAPVLAAMPTDASAEIAHGASLFPARDHGESADVAAERERIDAILRAPEAEGREKRALAFALADIPAETAVHILSQTPQEAGVASLEQRAAEAGPEFGPQPERSAEGGREGREAAARDVWSRAIEKVNASVPKAAPTPDPAFGAEAAAASDDEAAQAEAAWKGAIARANG